MLSILYFRVDISHIKHNKKQKVKQMENKQTETNEKIPEQDVKLDWLDNEEKVLSENTFDGEMIEGLILGEGKISEFDIIVGDEPFNRWKDESNGVIKVIIPVDKDGKKFNFWLNIKNPSYKEIIQRLKKGQRHFKILRTGQMKQTRYNLID